MRGATSRKKGSTQHYRKISIHAPHARSDCKVRPTDAIHRHFNPRSSCEERLPHGARIVLHLAISIHAPHARSDDDAAMADHALFISIHAPHARSDSIRALDILPLRISIHAPHARSDSSKQVSQPVSVISIHAPHARSDRSSIRTRRIRSVFQSTLLMRGATWSAKTISLDGDISIHAPHARSDRGRGYPPARGAISIHAPHARSD